MGTPPGRYTRGMFRARFSGTTARTPLGIVFLLLGLCLAQASAAKSTETTQRHRQATSGQHPSAHQAKPRRGKAHKTQQAKPQSTSSTAGAYAQRADAMRWADEASERLDLPQEWVRRQISQALRLPKVEQLILPAPTPTAKNWAAYRSRFIEPRRIEAGLQFWQRHEATLSRAEQTYRVPASIIVGILGVETLYGQHMGGFRVIDALATLAFDFPQAHPRAAERQAFFRDELGHFLRLTERSGSDPQSWRGSYAGALGLPQFIPSSWARYAVDFDGNGHIDLFNSTADAIGSVANYFQAFQWKPGMATHYPVTVTAGQTDIDALLAPDILPTFSVERFQAKGALLEGAALQHAGPLALIELRNGTGAPSYVAGTENFYAVTRYNWSSYYAMAVIELGQAVAQRMGKTTP